MAWLFFAHGSLALARTFFTKDLRFGGFRFGSLGPVADLLTQVRQLASGLAKPAQVRSLHSK